MLKLIVVLLLVSSLSFASLPKDCDVIDINGASILLKSKSNQLFHIKNIHQDNIYLIGKTPNLTIKISPKKHAILLSTTAQENSFFCVESKPGSEQRVSCVSVVQICQLNKVKIAEKFKKTRWIEKNEFFKEFL